MPRRPRLALVGAAAGVGLVILTWFAAFHIGSLQRADERILRGFADLHHASDDRIANLIASLVNPKPFVVLAAMPVLIALARRRPRVAVAITVILLAANETTQLLKPLLADPRPRALLGHVHIDAASWPSGHATAAMSLALCAVLAAPARLRPWVAALGAAFAVAVSYSFLTLTWHYPSDVFGGFLVAVTWTSGIVGILFASEGRRARSLPVESAKRLSVRKALAPAGALLVGSLALVALIVLARPHAVVAYARVHTTFIIGAAAIGTLALALATAVTLLSDPARAAPARPGRPSTGSGPAPTAAPRQRWHRDLG